MIRTRRQSVLLNSVIFYRKNIPLQGYVSHQRLFNKNTKMCLPLVFKHLLEFHTFDFNLSFTIMFDDFGVRFFQWWRKYIVFEIIFIFCFVRSGQITLNISVGSWTPRGRKTNSVVHRATGNKCEWLKALKKNFEGKKSRIHSLQ